MGMGRLLRRALRYHADQLRDCVAALAECSAEDREEDQRVGGKRQQEATVNLWCLREMARRQLSTHTYTTLRTSQYAVRPQR
jgi:hypothetical protein